MGENCIAIIETMYTNSPKANRVTSNMVLSVSDVGGCSMAEPYSQSLICFVNCTCLFVDPPSLNAGLEYKNEA